MRFVPLVAVVLLFWICVFYVGFKARGISVFDFLYGPREPLPEIGAWREVARDAGEVREERRLLPGGQTDPSFLILQVRFLDERSGDLLRALPETREARQRQKK
jgi:hypothetical protein